MKSGDCGTEGSRRCRVIQGTPKPSLPLCGSQGPGREQPQPRPSPEGSARSGARLPHLLRATSQLSRQLRGHRGTREMVHVAKHARKCEKKPQTTPPSGCKAPGGPRRAVLGHGAEQTNTAIFTKPNDLQIYTASSNTAKLLPDKKSELSL